MEITEIKVFPVTEEKLKAFVSVVFDRCFMINDIKIISGKEGLFISMPSRRKKNGKFKDIAHPLNNETRQWMEQHILLEYERALGGESGGEMTSTEAPGGAGGRPVGSQPEQGGGDEENREDKEQKSLEEVAEMHLRDSFWTS